ncbi:MAG: hypothetical protein ACRD29_25050 [Acidimicrobiales bacterium]
MADRTDEPAAAVDSAAPPVGARVLAFVSILIAGLAGGLIGYAITELQCTGDCEVAKGIGGLAGAVLAALGVAVVTVLVMRAMGEWRTIRHRQNRNVRN